MVNRVDRRRNQEKKKVKKKDMEMPGIEPGASYMQSMRSTTELHPQPLKGGFFEILCYNFKSFLPNPK